MDEFVENNITLRAKSVAKFWGIEDSDRVINILKKTAIDSNGIRFQESNNSLDKGLLFYPSLELALSYQSTDKALSLFETSDIKDLASKVSYFDFLMDNQTPFYKHHELADIIQYFIKYLTENKSSLLAIGYPRKNFEKSPWLYENLSRLYPVKIPLSVQDRHIASQKHAEFEGYAERDDHGNLIFNYEWCKEDIYGPQHYKYFYETVTRCSYEEAAVISSLSEKDVIRIELNRAKLFYVKLGILEISHKYLAGQMDKSSYWDECFKFIAQEITEDVFSHFESIEEAYSHIFSYAKSEGFEFGQANPITLLQPNLDAGGIKNVMNFILFIDSELNIGQMHKTKSVFQKLFEEQTPNSYFEIAFSPQIGFIDNALKESLSDSIKTNEFIDFFNERFRTDSKEKFKMRLEIPIITYDAVSSYAYSVEQSRRFGIDVNHSVQLPSGKKITPISLPSGTRWKDITIKFLDGHQVRIECKGKTFISDYKEMGFENSKTLSFNEQWEFLKKVAENHGEYSWYNQPQDKNTNSNYIAQLFGHETSTLAKSYQIKENSEKKSWTSTKKTKQLLSKTLKTLFQIDSDPFFPYKKARAYKIRITLIPD